MRVAESSATRGMISQLHRALFADARSILPFSQPVRGKLPGHGKAQSRGGSRRRLFASVRVSTAWRGSSGAHSHGVQTQAHLRGNPSAQGFPHELRETPRTAQPCSMHRHTAHRARAALPGSLGPQLSTLRERRCRKTSEASSSRLRSIGSPLMVRLSCRLRTCARCATPLLSVFVHRTHRDSKYLRNRCNFHLLEPDQHQDCSGPYVQLLECLRDLIELLVDHQNALG